MSKKLRSISGIAILTILILGLIGCELYESSDPVTPSNDTGYLTRNWSNRGVPDDYSCSKSYGAYVLQPTDTAQGLIVLVLPKGTHTLTYITENVSEYTFTHEIPWDIGTHYGGVAPEKGQILTVLVDGVEVIKNGVVNTDVACALTKEQAQFSQAEPVSEPTSPTSAKVL